MLILRTNAVLVWKVLPAACCQQLLLSAGEHWLQLQLQFVSPMNVRAVPGDVDVTVSALSPQRVAAERAPALPPLSLAFLALAQAGWRLMQLLE